jgi:hypothetical protein
MRHLNDAELVDFVEGRLTGPQTTHAKTCADCLARAATMRDALAGAADVPVPEPSPLFWEHLSSRISTAIDREPAPRAGRAWRPLRAPAWAWAVTAVLAALVVTATLWRGWQPGVQPTQVAADRPARGQPQADTNRDVWNEDVEEDQAWAVVRAVAEDIGWDGANDADISVRPQSADHVVPQLSSEERSELARLIEEELRRSGA